MTLPDGTEIVHSQIINESGVRKVIVNFERPNSSGDFDSARCELSSYRWLFRTGYTDEEMVFFTELQENNAHLLYRYAASGGIHLS